MQPTVVLGFMQFAKFPGKCEYFIPLREICLFVSLLVLEQGIWNRGFRTVELAGAV